MTLGKKNPPVFYWIIVSMIIKVKLGKMWQLLMPDAIFFHPVCQDRSCLASNIMGVLWAIFKLKGLDEKEVFIPPCAVSWEWVGSSWPGGCWDLGASCQFSGSKNNVLPSASAYHPWKAELLLLLYLHTYQSCTPHRHWLWDLPAALSRTCAGWLSPLHDICWSCSSVL